MSSGPAVKLAWDAVKWEVTRLTLAVAATASFATTSVFYAISGSLPGTIAAGAVAVLYGSGAVDRAVCIRRILRKIPTLHS
jgi:hypothetical protein